MTRSLPARAAPTIAMPAADGRTARTPVASRVCHGDPRQESEARRFVGSDPIGEALPPSVLGSMGVAFASSFSDVRVHSGARAARSAVAVGARAYTIGRDLVFGPGCYAPGTVTGDQLIAHELAHVLQQRTGPPRLLRAPAGRPVTDPVPAMRRDYVDDVIHYLQSAAEFYGLRGPTGPRNRQLVPLVRVPLGQVGPALAGWLRARELAVAVIDTQLTADQALTEQLRVAYRRAVRALIEAASRTATINGSGPTVEDLFAQHQQAIHEWGWPGSEFSAGRNELLGAVPQGLRNTIRVDSDQLSLPQARSWFAGNVQDLPAPAGTSVVLAPNVPAVARRGLRNLALSLTAGAAPPIPSGRTTTFLLSVSPLVPVRATYRLTHLRLPGQGGTPASRQILVEQVGAVHQERDAVRPPPGAQEMFQRYGFTRGDGWADEDQFGRLLAVLARVPAGVLAQARGIRFNRVRAVSLAGRAAEYSVDRHAIDLGDDAYANPTGERRFQGERGAGTDFEFLITHEIGHAVDQRALRGPMAAANRTTNARNQFLRGLGRPNRQGQVPIPPNRVAEWNTVRRASDVARTALTRVRGISGKRITEVGSNLVPTDELPRGERNAFRDAARADGGIRITNYSDTSWSEFFAEGLALYLADPETMALLRPHLFAFFSAEFPPDSPPAQGGP